MLYNVLKHKNLDELIKEVNNNIKHKNAQPIGGIAYDGFFYLQAVKFINNSIDYDPFQTRKDYEKL